MAREHEYDPSMDYRLCALIVSGGNIVSSGFNKRGGSQLQEYYRTTDRAISVHAEVDAILRARRKIDMTGSKIYVVRLLRTDRHGKPVYGMARPCEMCSDVLYAYGIKRAVYSVDSNTYGVTNIVNPNTLYKRG